MQPVWEDWTASDKITDLYGLFISSSLAPNGAEYAGIVNTYGIYSDVRDHNDGKTYYNFYAAGTAPNYFKGNTFFGNVGDGTAEANQANKTVIRGDGRVAIRGGDGYAGLGVFCDRFSGATTGWLSMANFVEQTAHTANNQDAIGFAYDIDNSKYVIKLGLEGNVQTASDYRLKSNIVDLPSAVDTIKALQPREYDFLDRGKRIGFVAHELQAVVPECVSGTQDETEAIGTLADYDGTVLETEVTEPSELEYTEETTDEYGVSTQTIRTRTWTPTGTRPVYQGVDQTKLIPLLTKALQEALERIEVLEAEHATMMGNNNGGY